MDVIFFCSAQDGVEAVEATVQWKHKIIRRSERASRPTCLGATSCLFPILAVPAQRFGEALFIASGRALHSGQLKQANYNRL